MNSKFSSLYIKMTITFNGLIPFQENKVFQTARTMNNFLKSNAKWWLCYHRNHNLEGLEVQEMPVGL